MTAGASSGLAADPPAHGRAHALGLVTEVSRQQRWGLGPRHEFLLTARPGLWCSRDGYAVNWAIEASRHAVTADTALLLGVLHDPDPEIRIRACDTLATALGSADRTAAPGTAAAGRAGGEVRACCRIPRPWPAGLGRPSV
ncbi:hypothetical protein [Kitasatospora sp. NPDC051914]|uniref:hypothetical protein n=1 Tax=Kitasatospora sp. NPDC051914 TaxID=3154945 RepID=UPI003422F8EC